MRKNWAANHTRPKHDQRRERPHGAAESRPGPFGLRGSLPPLAAPNRSSCLGRVQKSEQAVCNALRNANRNDERRPAVPILKAPPKQSKNESLQLRVSKEFKFKLQRYAEFLEATPSYVVIEALNRIFDKDRDFKTWLGKQPQSDNEIQSENDFIMETTRKS
jgi:hypothetical protein